MELVVAVALLSVVGAGIYRALVASQRAYLAHAQRVEMQQNLRAAEAILPAAFRELDAADSDITAMSATSITLRATEQLGFLCVAPELGAGGDLVVGIRQRPFFGARGSFSAGDSVLLYFEGDPAARSDDTWLPGQIITASSRDCSDPDQPRPGQELRLRLQRTDESRSDLRDGVTNGSPLRGFATMTYALYYSSTDRQWYLGQRLAGATIQPLLGPLSGADGLTLSYYDSAGAPTATPTAVAEIAIRVLGRTAAPIRVASSGGTAHAVDSLVTRVALRNNPRR